MMKGLIILAFLGLFHLIEAIADPTASSPLGKYQGTIMKNSYDKPFFAFRGIRYAVPPVGELRFKPAQPIKKHEGVYDATNDAPACPQPPLGDDPMSEDCLFLNVYTTKLPTQDEKIKRPVIVFIYPSSSQQYSSRSNLAGPQYLLNEDIVLVTFNYRLGVLGFISTGDKEAPGNLALKDQVEVLRWVKQNIEGFGGDPNSVTLYGVVDGGACVNVHLVSPLTKGLFHKAIISTGTISGVYPIGKSQLKLTKRQAKIVGCPNNSTSSMMECLRKKPAEELGKSIAKLNPLPYGLPIWRPVIEEDFGQERLLTDHPVKLILEGKFHQVPILVGYNSDEFSHLAIELVKNKEKLEKFDREFEKEAAKLFSYDHDKLRAKSISEDLRSFYFGDKKIDNSTLPQLTDLYNDGLIGIELHRALTLLAQKSNEPIFHYHYSYKGSHSHYNPKEGPVPKGPVLNDELIYIFFISAKFPEIKKDDPEFFMVERMRTVIKRFISIQNSNSSNIFEPYDIITQKYLDNNKEATMKEGLYRKRFAEWDKFFPLTKYDVVQDASPQV